MTICTIFVRGDADISQKHRIASAIDAATAADVVVVDVTHAGFCDTTFINALASLRKRLLNKRRFSTMVVTGASPRLQRVLHLLNLIEFLNVTAEPMPPIVEGAFVHHTRIEVGAPRELAVS